MMQDKWEEYDALNLKEKKTKKMKASFKFVNVLKFETIGLGSIPDTVIGDELSYTVTIFLRLLWWGQVIHWTVSCHPSSLMPPVRVVRTWPGMTGESCKARRPLHSTCQRHKRNVLKIRSFNEVNELVYFPLFMHPCFCGVVRNGDSLVTASHSKSLRVEEMEMQTQSTCNIFHAHSVGISYSLLFSFLSEAYFTIFSFIHKAYWKKHKN